MVSYERILRSGRRSKKGTELCQKKSKKLIILQLQPASCGYCLLVQISYQPAEIAAADSNKQLIGSNYGSH